MLKNKILYSFLTIFFIGNTYAQMVDIIGNIGVSGTIIKQDVENVNHMNKSFLTTQAFQTYQTKIMTIKLDYFGNYKAIPKSNLTVGGMTIIFSPSNDGKYYIAQSQNINKNMCADIIASGDDTGLVFVEVKGKKYSLIEAHQKSSEICTSLMSFYYQ